MHSLGGIMIKHVLGLMTVGAGLALLTPGCGDDDPIDEVDQRVDCLEICDRYSECVEEIDVTACTDACEERIDVEPGLEAQADQCEDCLDNRSCGEIEDAGCFDNCPVVPLQD